MGTELRIEDFLRKARPQRHAGSTAESVRLGSGLRCRFAMVGTGTLHRREAYSAGRRAIRAPATGRSHRGYRRTRTRCRVRALARISEAQAAQLRLPVDLFASAFCSQYQPSLKLTCRSRNFRLQPPIRTLRLAYLVGDKWSGGIIFLSGQGRRNVRSRSKIAFPIWSQQPRARARWKFCGGGGVILRGMSVSPPSLH
jgi:hypothetical protein